MEKRFFTRLTADLSSLEQLTPLLLEAGIPTMEGIFKVLVEDLGPDLE